MKKIKDDLRKYFVNHPSIIYQYYQTKDSIDKQTFECILRSSSNLLINDTYLESLWNLCQPDHNGITYQTFLQHFAPLPRNECQLLNYITRICHTVKQNWQNLKNDFFMLDRHGRLFITIDQAINLIRNYAFPLNDKQQYELVLLFSPKKNGQFHYFDFMQYFTNQSTSQTSVYSRSTHTIQSKQLWTSLPVTIDCILNRIRSNCISNYGSVYRMFNKFDKDRQNYLTKYQFNQLLEKFHIRLKEDDELYHIMSEIDKNQDGLISYNELYDSLITNALQI
ncbi:hypothetical protein I4U23_021201 [Adineta vaga]|nr:hypothetical protein I4U23_021201 [Adineta vaga]